MSRKIWLSIIAVILLIGTVALIAQEQADPEQGQRRMQRQRLKAHGETPMTSEQYDTDVAPRSRRMRQGRLETSAGPNRPIQQRLDRWLNALTKAYKENDREEMGRLIRNMRQARKEMRERVETRQQRRQDVSEQERDRRRLGRFQPGMERPHEDFDPRRFDKPRPPRPLDEMGGSKHQGTPRHIDRPEPPRRPRPRPERGWHDWDRSQHGWDHYDYTKEKPAPRHRWQDDMSSEWD